MHSIGVRERVSRTAFHALRVQELVRVCADAVAVSFDVPPELAETYAFRPGQHLTLRRTFNGVEERRSYSICAPFGSPPRVGVRELPGGQFSTWLVHDVRVGDEIEVSPPAGTFTPDLDEAGHHLLLAAGSGITPILSIAGSILTNPKSRVTLLYGNRRADTVMFVDELADLKDQYLERFELVHVLSREARDSELFTGRLDSVKLTALFDSLVRVESVGHSWLCGPYELVVDAQRLLERLGVEPGRVHRELFYVEDDPPAPVRRPEAERTGPSSAVTVVLDGRATTMTLPRDTPILDGAQRVRPDLPFACKGGVCGTCRAAITAGAVHLRRNFALEPAELEAGFVLTCQSLPVSDQLTVDYDA